MPTSPDPMPHQKSPTAMWVMLAGVAASTLVAVAIDGRLGVFLMAATAGLGAVARATMAEPLGVMIRGRKFDIAVYATFAVILAVFGVIAPEV